MARKRKKKGPGPHKKLRQVIDPMLAQALSHPLRGHILMTLGDGTASPSEIAKELEMNARDLTYHFGILVEVKMIKLVRTEKRRGALEHFYGLDQPTIYIDDPQWDRMPGQIQSRFSAGFLQRSTEAAVDALHAGTFNAHASHHSRTTMLLDEQGRHEVFDLMRRTLEQILGFQSECAKRLSESSEGGIPVEVVMMGFETATGAAELADGNAAGLR